MARGNALLRLSSVLLLVVAVVRPGDGLHCYKCTSESDPKCQTNPQETQNCQDLPDITGGLFDVKPVCLKVIAKDKEHGGKSIVMRSCVIETSLMKTCDIAGKIDLPSAAEITFCDTCDGELCNNSNRLAISFLQLFLACIMSLILSLNH